jgi:protoporphyrinogen oxidase
MDNASIDTFLKGMAQLRKVQALAIDPSTTPGERAAAQRMAEKLGKKLAAHSAAWVQREPEYLRKKYASPRHYVNHEERLRRARVELKDVDYAMKRLGKAFSRVKNNTLVKYAADLGVHPDLLRGAVAAYRKKEDWTKLSARQEHEVK